MIIGNTKNFYQQKRKTNNTFKEIGRREEAMVIAKKLFSKNMDIKEIAEVTGLSIEKLEKLK